MKTIYKVWMQVERRETDDDGIDEGYENIGEAECVGEFSTVEGAQRFAASIPRQFDFGEGALGADGPESAAGRGGTA